MTEERQPDQRPERWGDHVTVYETVFEPLTDHFSRAAVDALDLAPGMSCLDVAAGTGSAALMAARRGAAVLAVDASPAMTRRARVRAADAGLTVAAAVMDAERPALAEGAFDAALSVFGIILCPDAEGALRGLVRAVRPGGRVAIATWTEPQNYELVARLVAAIVAVRGPQPPLSGVPAQLRFKEEAAFRALLEAGGLVVEGIRRIEARLEARSARWLAARLDFAPGLAAMMAGQGAQREAVLERFASDLERDQGAGAVALGAVGFLGVGRRGA